MRTTTQMSITLPNTMAQDIKTRVAAGEYASESEMVREGLRALAARNAAVERWLETEAVAAFDEASAHPELSKSSEEVRAMLNDQVRARLTKTR